MSLEAKYWLKSYLVGSEPEPPVDEEGDIYPPDHSKALHWSQSIEMFHQTGYWTGIAVNVIVKVVVHACFTRTLSSIVQAI